VACFTARNEDGSAGGAENEAGYEGNGIMLGAGKRGGLRRGAADFALAFILFWAVVLSFDAGHSRAYAVSLPTLAKEAILPDSAVSSPASLRADRPRQSIHKVQTSPEQARLLLSFAFAALVALNLGFWRHLRRVYASPRRSVWRRG
jgi:hypothetical protein